MAPPKSRRAARTTGAERGLKFRVGSSSNSTSALFSTMSKNSSLARWPPLRRAIFPVISSWVKRMLPRQLRALVRSSFV